MVGGGIIPACRIIDLSTQFINEATAVINNNETTVTSLGGVAPVGIGIFDDALMQAKINADKFAFEMIAQEPSFLGENIMAVGFGEPDVFSSGAIGVFALGIPPLGTGVGDWEITFLSDFMSAPIPVLSNLTITFPYIVKVVIQGNNLTFKDNQVPANTGVLGAAAGLSSVFGSFVMANGVNNSLVGNTQTLKVEGKKENFVIDFENDALDWCQLEQSGVLPSVPYTFQEFFQSGSATFLDRVAGWNTVNGVGATWIGSASYSLVNTEVKNNYVFEFPTIIADLDSTAGGKLIRYQVGNVFADTCSAGILTSIITGGSSRTGVSFNTQDTIDSNYDALLQLFEIPTELDFVVSIAIINLNNVRICYKTAKQTVFFQEIKLRNYGNASAATATLNQSSSGLPSGQEYRVQYNGIDADLVINNYPTNFLGFDGSALPTKTAVENLDAAWLLDYKLFYPENILGGEYVDITNSGRTANAITTFDQSFLLNCSRFIQRDEGGFVAVSFQIYGLVTGGTNPNAYRFELQAMNRVSNCRIELVGADLLLRVLINGVSQPDQIIKTNYVAAIGDQFCLAMDNQFALVRGILQQSGVLYDTGYVSADNAVEVSWMPRAGHDNANGNTMLIVNQYLNVDLPVGVLKTQLITDAFEDILRNAYS